MARVTMASTLGEFLQRSGHRVPQLLQALEEDRAQKERVALEQSRHDEAIRRQDSATAAENAYRDRIFKRQEANDSRAAMQDIYGTVERFATRDYQHGRDVIDDKYREDQAAREDRYREKLLGSKQPATEKAHPSGAEAVTAWRAGRKIPNPASETGAMMDAPMTRMALDTLNALNMTGQFPQPQPRGAAGQVGIGMAARGGSLAQFSDPARQNPLYQGGAADPESIGRSKYDDWDQLPAEVKQALIQGGFPD